MLEALGRLCRGQEGAYFLAWLRQHAPSWLAQMPALLPDADRAACQRLAQDVTQARMLRELAEALESLTAERPLILILEDLHWSDGATLEWLAYVARRQDSARLLILGTYRLGEARAVAHPLYAVTRELLVHGQGAELVLGVLSVAEVATYVTQRLGEGDLAADLIPVLYERTQGNPLFLVTMVADLVQRGVLQESPTGWERTAALDTATMGVPETLRHLIEQQFERLWNRRTRGPGYSASSWRRQGLQVLAEVIGRSPQPEERLGEAELYRLTGELLQQTDMRCKAAYDTRALPESPEACFLQALAIARRQHARSLELRVAISLGHLWQRQGQHAAAHQLLMEVYGWFTEGFNTADLQAAQTLLADLAGAAPATQSDVLPSPDVCHGAQSYADPMRARTRTAS